MRRRTFLASLAAGATAALSSSAFGASPRMKLYDTHAHFYSNDFEHYPLRADVAPAALAKARTHPMTVEAMLGMWRQASVELGCGVQYNTTYATDNRYLLDVAAAHPDRIRPVVILGPTDPATPAALGRMAKDNRICGVRFAGLPGRRDAGSVIAWRATGATRFIMRGFMASITLILALRAHAVVAGARPAGR